MHKVFGVCVLIIAVFSCSKTVDIPVSGNKAIPIYNQAYAENIEPDKISDILANAHNAYVLIDPFDENIFVHILALKANGNQVGAYVSIGTGETYRSDFDQLEPYLVSSSWGEWPDEYFVNSTTTGIIDVMKLRIDQIAAWGCNWVEFDNMDWAFDDEMRTLYGFEVTEAQGIAYYNTLCDYVHQKGMKCMAKNTVYQAEHFDGVLYESFHDDKNWWDESGALSFLSAGKLVIINHYGESDCDQVYADYKGIYSDDLSFICEDVGLGRYVHYNE